MQAMTIEHSLKYENKYMLVYLVCLLIKVLLFYEGRSC